MGYVSDSNLLHLVEAHLDRGLAAEDGYQDLELAGVLVDLGDLAGEVRQRTGDHLDRLADLELGARARGSGALLVQQAVHLRLRQGDGRVRGPYEPGHARGALD